MAKLCDWCPGKKPGMRYCSLMLQQKEAELDDIKARIVTFQPEIAIFDTSTPSILSDVSALENVKGWFKGDLVTILVGTHPLQCRRNAESIPSD
jgi:hypothetical protein